jgi:hypothetical protein
MNNMHILNKDKKPVLEKDLEKAAEWYEKNGVIKQTEVQQYFISTIFLLLKLGNDSFETMVFTQDKSGKLDKSIECYRHSTYKEAIDFHNDLVKKYKEKVKNKK